MTKSLKLKALGLSAIIFSLTLAYNTVQACCPTNSPNTTATDVSSETVGDPIGIIDGKVLLEERDLVLQTPILGLEFIRSWRTPGNSSGVLPGGWEHSFEWKVLSDEESGIPSGTNTYQGVTGEYKVVKIPVNPYDGAFKGGKYFFVKGTLGPHIGTIIGVYNCVGRELKGASLYQTTSGWELSGISGSSVRYLFNTNGYLTQISHPSSVNITLSYNSNNQLTNVAHSSGTSLSLTYSGNYLTQVRNNRDTNLWMQYSYGNNIFTATRHISSSSSDNLSFKYYYKSYWDEANSVYRSLVYKKENPVGDQYLWRYLTDGSLLADGAWIVSGGITNNYGTTLVRQTNSHNTRMNVEVQTDRFGGAIAYTTNRYDLIRMVPTRITGPLPTQVERRTYNADKDLTRQYFVWDWQTAISGSSYDTNRNVIGLYSAYGIDTSSYEADKEYYLDYSLTWTDKRQLSSVRDTLDRGYQFQYNSYLDSPIQISAVDENNNTRILSEVSYNSEGFPLYYTNANGHVTTYTYSTTSGGRSVTVQPPLGYSKTIAFDHLWRPTSFSEYDYLGNQETTYFQTDYAGRLLAITNAWNHVTSFQYDKAGRLIYAEDPSGYYVTNQWRLGKLVSQTTGKTGSSVSANISLEYDPQMTMASVKDPKNRYVETYGLDAAGQVTNVTNLDGRRLAISRGVQGKIDQIDRYDSNDQYEGSIYVYYDEKGRPYSVLYPDTSYSYDYLANGLLSSISGNNNTIGLSYDTWNDLVQVRNNVENWLYTTNYYAYDAEGNLTNKVLTFTDYNDTYTLINSTYLYDDNERLIGENDANGNPLWRYGYNPYSGKLTCATNMVTGVYCTYFYDYLGRIIHLVYSRPTRSWIPYYIDYSYNSSGKICSKYVYGGGQNGGGFVYTFDELGRLKEERSYGVSTNTYTYDLAGNRTSVSNIFTMAYSTPTNNNRLSTWGSNGSMSYNDAGCVTYLTRNTKTNISSLSLSWNGEYQLTQVEVVDPGYNYNYVYYTYDSLGRKTSRMDNDTWEYYIYDGMNLVADYDAYNGRITRTYSYGPGIDNIQSMTIYDEYGGSETYYYIKDLSNTVHALVNGNSEIVEYYYYDAFGNFKIMDDYYLWIPESVYGNRFLFQGREYDYDTALYYFRNRWYEPETGRWLSPDPIGISGGLNLYAFCGNDPVNFVDPWGLDVYRVISSKVCGVIPFHEIIVGDNGKGGAYIVQFYPKRKYCPLSVGETHYGIDNCSAIEHIKNHPEYVIKDVISTSNIHYYPGNVTVDEVLALKATQVVEKGFGLFGLYIFTLSDCQSFATDWMKNAKRVRDNALHSIPYLFPPGIFD